MEKRRKESGVGDGERGTPITIKGTGFVTGATVEIGQGNGAGPTAIPASKVVVVSSTEITAVTGGPAKPGAWNLFVVDSGEPASPTPVTTSPISETAMGLSSKGTRL